MQTELKDFTMDFFRLDAKVAIVTGGNTELGQAYAVAFANELACHNIQINAIAPGYIETANTAPIRADEKRNEEILSRVPANHWAKPSELMGAIVLLCSKASDYVNGHILAVDGGWLVR